MTTTTRPIFRCCLNMNSLWNSARVKDHIRSCRVLRFKLPLLSAKLVSAKTGVASFGAERTRQGRKSRPIAELSAKVFTARSGTCENFSKEKPISRYFSRVNAEKKERLYLAYSNALIVGGFPFSFFVSPAWKSFWIEASVSLGSPNIEVQLAVNFWTNPSRIATAM